MTEAGFHVETPLGTMRATISDGCLMGLDFAAGEHGAAPASAGERALLALVQRQMDEWWMGARAQFELPLAARGTAFQRAVWAAAQAVPRGSVVSYGALAASLGRERAQRAVGAALGRNPWLLVVPCHRIVAADGGLAGYAGGVTRKRELLAAEARFARAASEPR